jgi:hypothetical protein
LAGLCDIEVEAVDPDIRADAQIFPYQDGRLLIQYTRTVSAERYRLVDRSNQPCAVVFLTKRLKPKEKQRHPEFDLGLERPQPKFRVDYLRNSVGFAGYFPQHKSAPDVSVVYKAVGEHFPSVAENWDTTGSRSTPCKLLPCR